MESQDELEQARNEVHRKIGRNMLLFQHLEILLKFIIANGKVSAPISQLKTVVDRQAKAIKNKTLGHALGVFIENFHNSFTNSESGHLDSTEIVVSYSLTIEHNPDNPSHHEARRNALAEILKQRNDLVHHLFLKIKPTSIESWREIGILP